MLDIDNYLKYTIITYLLSGIFIWIQKPAIMFDTNGKMKNFGVGPTKTIFYYPLILIIIAIVLFSIFNNLYLRKSLL